MPLDGVVMPSEGQISAATWVFSTVVLAGDASPPQLKFRALYIAIPSICGSVDADQLSGQASKFADPQMKVPPFWTSGGTELFWS